jgi:hypothetical protein
LRAACIFPERALIQGEAASNLVSDPDAAFRKSSEVPKQPSERSNR